MRSAQGAELARIATAVSALAERMTRQESFLERRFSDLETTQHAWMEKAEDRDKQIGLGLRRLNVAVLSGLLAIVAALVSGIFTLFSFFPQ